MVEATSSLRVRQSHPNNQLLRNAILQLKLILQLNSMLQRNQTDGYRASLIALSIMPAKLGMLVANKRM